MGTQTQFLHAMEILSEDLLTLHFISMTSFQTAHNLCHNIEVHMGGLKTDSKIKQKITQKLSIANFCGNRTNVHLNKSGVRKQKKTGIEGCKFLIYFCSEAIAKNGLVISSKCSH